MTEIAARFESKVERVPFMPCWIWTGAANEHGYGVIGRGRRGEGNEKAHRLAYRLYKGEIPDGKIVLHKCGNPFCVNPSHLEAGTYKTSLQLWKDVLLILRHAVGAHLIHNSFFVRVVKLGNISLTDTCSFLAR